MQTPQIKLSVQDLRQGERTVVLQEPSVASLIQALGESEQSVLISVNNSLATKDTILTEKDSIQVIPVISGG